MKNLKDLDDPLRAEYRRSDFSDLVQGKFSSRPVGFSELVDLLIACVGEDENVRFVHRSSHVVAQKQGDWTYEVDNAAQITLRYWLSEFESLEELVPTSQNTASPQGRTELQKLLSEHTRSLKARVVDR
jgi:hypothetical protein